MQHKKLNEPTPKQNQMIQNAMALHHAGQLDAAEAQYRKLLNCLPSHVTLLTNLGTIALQKGQLEDGVRIIEKSLEINPNQASALNNCGIAFRALNRLAEALASYERAIALKPDYVEVYYNQGLVMQDLNRMDEALASYDSVIALKPDSAEVYYNQGLILQGLDRLDEALVSYDRAIALKPDYFEAYYNRGLALQDLQRLDEALASYELAIVLKPACAKAYYNCGNILKDLQRLDDALVTYNCAIAIQPDDMVAYSNRGNVLKDLHRLDEALASYDRAIVLKPDYIQAYSNRGAVLQDLKRLDEALASYDCAIALKPDYAEAYSNRGHVLKDLKRLDEALASYECALALKAEIDFILGASLHIKMQLCFWDNLSHGLNELTHKINQGEKVSMPFDMLTLVDDPELHRKTAEAYVKQKYPQSHVLPKIQRYPQHSKLRVGYFSADFRDHPVSGLSAELYERHDRNQFEIHAFSFGPDTQDEWNLRIKAGVDYFHDVRTLSDKEIALLARNLEIDIAVDLGGYTTGARTGVFAMQAAPIQVSYLGYPSTMAAVYIDYLIADRTLIPEDQQRHYLEKIVYLPSATVNLSKRTVSERVLTRQEFGLPETGFVFCCFNSHYKITPTTFAGWMRILNAVEGSVLWLLDGPSEAVTNLKKEAIKVGINEERLIFAKHMPLEEQLKRTPLADLFMDTLPYNAGTTACNTLRMGVPVLTCMGQSLVSRIAASLLNAVNMPELITTTQEHYEALAIELAMQPEKLTLIKAQLVANLANAPLYDTSLYTKHLESAYLTMYERYQNGLAPEHIVVEH